MAQENDKDRKVQSKIVPPKDDFYMGVLFVASACCKDPFGQNAALIIDSKDNWISFGVNKLMQTDTYNQKKFSWEEPDRSIAVMTAIEVAVQKALKNHTYSSYLDTFSNYLLYCNYTPGLKEVKYCLFHGLKDIVYHDVKSIYYENRDWEAICRLIDAHHLKLQKFEGNINWARDRLNSVPFAD